MLSRDLLLRSLTCFALALAGCSSDDGGADGGADPDATADAGAADTGTPDAGAESDAGAETDAGVAMDAGDTPDGGEMDAGTPPVNPDCDPLMPSVCSLPWPSNRYLEPDGERVTGFTLAFGATTLPATELGLHVDPAPYRRLDGYGLGTPIMVLFPDLDAANLPDENDIGASLDGDADILLFADTGKGLARVPYFAELDGKEADPAVRTLFVRPAVILEEDTRYVVAMRGLVNTDGAPYPRSEAFAALVDGTSDDPRQDRFTALFSDLAGAGIDVDDVQLAWDFHTASCDALHGPMLHMRDEGLATIDANPPTPTVTSVTEYVPADDGSGRPIDPDLWLRVEAEVEVPSYLRPKTINLFNGTVLARDGDGMPMQNGTRTIPIWMNVPRAAETSTMTFTVYGHGLLGRGSQALSSYNRPVANRENLIIVGADLTGFHEPFLTNVGVALRDMTAFEWVADTTHQGILEYLMLGRILLRRGAAIAAIADNNIRVDDQTLYYAGISQGGIFGGTFMALSTDAVHGHLGVPGNNYSTLLDRSVDFVPFFEMLAPNYPRSVDQSLLLTTVEQIWEQTDPVSYMRHIVADPFPNTPPHRVLLGPAKGDYQVAVITNEIVARSDIGIPLMANYAADRTVFGAPEAAYPRAGSGTVLWDFGNPWPPAGNVPPMDELGDPHGLPRRDDQHIRQLGHFLRTGEIIDVCGGDGCTPN